MATVAINVATAGVFGKLKKGIQVTTNVISCGIALTDAMRRLIELIAEINASLPGATKNKVRALVSASAIVTKELPNAALTCVGKEGKHSYQKHHSKHNQKRNSESYQQRNKIIKLVSVLLEQVLDSTERDGKPLSAGDFKDAIVSLGLNALASFDTTGLMNLVDQFAESLCDLPVMYGDIDDGPTDVALGMNTIDKAFDGSSGIWTFSGDGIVTIAFESLDFLPVTINVLSGGKQIDKVFVPIKKRIVYTKNLKDLQDRTLYLDRWRAGFAGVAGTGGGSLSIWVPHSSQGGHLAITAKINPTSYGTAQVMNAGDNRFTDNDLIRFTKKWNGSSKCTITLKCSLGWWKAITDETTDDGDAGQREIVSTQDNRQSSSYTNTADYHNRHQYMLAKAKVFGVHTPMYPLVVDFQDGYEYVFEWLQH
ncbi:TPA: hypothetical protein N0F65_000329 [Lagenidium giganteum]|uniref:Uncharacterized protein n=1 Tax=Lagenidium giganteum TaxID=4803 RepID=A0AAV2YLH9_9STRA|nr:TPA: hypothetical protein N0F65_000329 [Lagenidium giganteum]